MNRIAIALAVAAVIPASAAAQSDSKEDWQAWNHLLKPYEAKTNPNVPIAPAVPEAPVPPTVQLPPPPPSPPPEELSYTLPETINTALLDAFIIEAIGRLPNFVMAPLLLMGHSFQRQFDAPPLSRHPIEQR